ncbi:MAG: sporulation protein [Defluviitaleaceae bacterium]|nr:sporulation protein [Defluviitaleaceae bacterium]
MFETSCTVYSLPMCLHKYAHAFINLLEKAGGDNLFRIKEKMAGALSVPKEILLDMPLVMATGRGEMNIENYKNILEFTDTKLRVGTKDGVMVIEGEQLKLRQLTSENLLISGRISGVAWC